MFAITVLQVDNRDLALYTTAPTASEMEDTVTELHKEYPAPAFEVRVEQR